MRKIRAASNGSMLVEYVVTIAIMSILALVTISMLIGVLTAVGESSQRLNQYENVETLYGFNSLRLASTQQIDLGQKTSGVPAKGSWLPTQSGILPSTVAGDQLVYSRGSKCYRMYFRGEKFSPAYRNSLNIAIADYNPLSGACPLGSSSQVFRGPNQPVPGFAGAGGSSDNIPEPGELSPSSPYYDPVLDKIGSIGGIRVTLVKGIIAMEPATPNQIFWYRDSAGIQAGVQPQATMGSNLSILRSAAYLNTLNSIAYLNIKTGILANSETTVNLQRVQTKPFDTDFYFNQICPPSQ